MDSSNVFKVYVRVKKSGLTARDVNFVIDANAPLLVDMFDEFELKAIGAHMPYCILVFRFSKIPWKVQGFIRSFQKLFETNEFLEVIMIEPNEDEDAPFTHRSSRGVLEIIEPTFCASNVNAGN